jgi:transposase-like protein
MTEYDPDTHCGHDTADGSPCLRTTGGELCWSHGEEPAPDGRSTKLSKEREEEIAQALEAGKSMTSAARMAGVSRNTVYSWIERGEQEENTVFAEFHDRIRRARGHGEDFYFTLALQLAKENEDHRFIASLMKQRYPQEWAETETGVDGVEITVSSDVVEVTEEDVQR